jgi:PAS domain S-box-containing protein
VLAFFTLLWGGYQMRVHQLAEQEKKFRDTVETMPALAFVADPKGSRTFLNRGWLEYTGLSSEQASGSGWQVAVHPDDLKRVTERWSESQTTGQPLDCEARLRRGLDGAYRSFLIRAVPVRVESQGGRFVGHIQRRTRRKAAPAEANVGADRGLGEVATLQLLNHALT